MPLQGKAAIITGAATGIGKAIAESLASEGVSIVADYVGSPDVVDAVCKNIQSKGGRAISVAADISKPEDVQHLVDTTCERFGAIDIVVNNAGIEQKHPFLETPIEVYDKVMAVNLRGTWLCTQIAARRMVEQKRGGRIINISSIHEEITMPTNSPYCATKAGARMLMRTIAIELAPHGITVNNVAPGAIDTPMDEALKKDPAQYAALLAQIPMARMGTPQEVAAVCVFLASDSASYVTGATYFVDGGMSKQAGSL